MPLTRNDYQNALDAQNACNLSGVVKAFAEVTPRIWEEARIAGKGTDYVNRHPISRLYAEKIIELASGHCGDFDTYSTALGAVRAKLREMAAV